MTYPWTWYWGSCNCWIPNLLEQVLIQLTTTTLRAKVTCFQQHRLFTDDLKASKSRSCKNKSKNETCLQLCHTGQDIDFWKVCCPNARWWQVVQSHSWVDYKIRKYPLCSNTGRNPFFFASAESQEDRCLLTIIYNWTQSVASFKRDPVLNFAGSPMTPEPWRRWSCQVKVYYGNREFEGTNIGVDSKAVDL